MEAPSLPLWLAIPSDPQVPISNKLLEQARSLPREVFDSAYDMETGSNLADLTPLLSQGVKDTPLNHMIRRIVQHAPSSTTHVIEFQDENEKALLEEIYIETPPHMISRLRSVIAWTLDLSAFSEEFWDVLIESVTDPLAYNSEELTHPEFRDPDGLNPSLLIHMTQSVVMHPDDDPLVIQDYLTSVSRHLMSLFNKMPILLEYDETMTFLDHYVVTDTEFYQYYVATIAQAMFDNRVDLIIWEDDTEFNHRTARPRGGIFHILLRHLMQREDMDIAGDHTLIPIHYRNFEYVWTQASEEDKMSRNHMNETVYQYAQRLRIMIGEDTAYEDLDKIMALTRPMTKRAGKRMKKVR